MTAMKASAAPSEKSRSSKLSSTPAFTSCTHMLPCGEGQQRGAGSEVDLDCTGGAACHRAAGCGGDGAAFQGRHGELRANHSSNA